MPVTEMMIDADSGSTASQPPTLPMKVLHVSKYDLKGGAAIAAYNSMRAQRDLGIDARMAVGRKLGSDPWVAGPSRVGDRLALVRFAAEQIPGRLIGANRYDSRSIGLFGRDPRSLFGDFDPDVVVLHNVDGVLSTSQIARIDRPLIWRLHDMWAISGHRHYTGLYYPRPKRLAGLASLIDRNARDAKMRLFARRQICFCPPSNWLAGEVRAALGSGVDVAVVPNSVDAEVFRPCDRDEARSRLGIAHDGPLLLFGAASGAGDLRKGGDLLVEALCGVSGELAARNIKLATFGGEWPAAWAERFPAISLGRTSDRAKLALFYAAADLTIVPSREENLSLTVLESLACGTPVVAFRIGGMPDMITDGRNGWLVDPFDVRALGERLLRAAGSKAMATAASESIAQHFDRASEARGMAALFRRLAPTAGA